MSPANISRRRCPPTLCPEQGCARLEVQEGIPAWNSGGTAWGCREPQIFQSLSPPLVPRNALLAPRAPRQQSSVCLLDTSPQMLPPLRDSKTRAHFLHVPTWWGDLQFRPPEHIPPAPFPQAAHRTGHQSWSTNVRDFISEHLTARCWRAGGVLGPALATVHVLTVLGSQHSAHGAQELVQGSVDLWGQERGVVAGHHHQEALAQQLKGKRMW